MDGVQLSQGLAFLTKFPDGYEELRREAQSVPNGSGSLVSFTRVRATLRDPNNNDAIVLQTTTDFPAGASEVPLTLSVPLPATAPATGMPLRLTLEYLNASDAVVFTGGPVGVTAVPVAPGQPAPPAAQITIPISYTGPGATAAGVRFTTAPSAVNTGQAFTFVAEAIDGAGRPITGVPILYNSLNPAVASINAATGAGTAGASRGSASIEAKLLTGPAVAAQLSVISPPATLAEVRGTGQTAPIGTVLATPVEVRVIATDGGPAPGVTVTFAPQNGGSVGNASIVTDQNGLATTTWRLGSFVGAQQLTASATGLANSPITFRATGLAIAPVRLVFGQQPPSSAAANSAITPAVTVHAVDANGAVTTAFNGTVSLALGPGVPASATLTGTASVTAVAGVATFSELKLNALGAYTLVATTTAAGVAGATSSPFTIIAGAANRLVFRSYPSRSGGKAGRPLDQVSVEVQDAHGNVVRTSTASVVLTANGPTALSAGTDNLPPGVARVTPLAETPAQALSGRPTVSAVGGVAIFSDLGLTRAGSYTLTASSDGLATATGDPFSIAPGPASLLHLVSGDKQEAPGGATLAKPIIVRVTDEFENGVGGVTVSFAPVAGHGLVNPTSAVSASDGSAQTFWTPAGSAGAKTLNVTSPSLVGQSLQVPATATTTSGAARTWTGATNNVFNVATNWSPNGVPGSADQLTIPTVGTAPANTGTITVGSLSLSSGATLANSGLITVNGSVNIVPLSIRESARVLADVLGGGITGNGQLTLAGAAGSTLSGGIVNQIVVSGNYTLAGYTTVSNAFQVISGGTVTLNGKSLYLESDFYTVGTGKIVMTNTGDYLTVEGNTNFGGGDEHGSLSAGTVNVARNFTATGSTYSATGSHLTLFSGNHEADQNIAFTSPIAGRGFNHVRFENIDSRIFSGAPTILGNVDIDESSTPVTGAVTVKVGGNLTDYTYVAYDTAGAWRVGTTDFIGGGTINSQFLTTSIIVSSGTRKLAQPIPVALAGIVDAGYTQLTGSIVVTGSSSTLDLNGTNLYISGDFATAAGGKLKMANEDDFFHIGGSATFGGAGASVLTAGEMEVVGNFFQTGPTSTAFAPTTGFYTYIGDPYCYYCDIRDPNARALQPGRGALRQPTTADQARAAQHAADAQRFAALRAPQLARREARSSKRRAVLAARNVRTAEFGRPTANPDVRRVGGRASVEETSIIKFDNPAGSFFSHLYLQGSAYELQSDVNVLGRLETGGGSAFTVGSVTPHTITSRGADVRQLNFYNTRWVLLDGDAIYALDNVEFVGMDPTVDQFTLSRSGNDLGGESSGYTLWYWYFETTPTSGRYINANDTNGAVPFVSLSLYSPTPSTHGGKIAATGGALINNWAAAFTWTGAGGNNLWTTSANWSTGFLPNIYDDVTIPAGTPFAPNVNATGYTRNLTVLDGATVTINGSLSVYGSLDAPTSYNAFPCTVAALYLTGAPGVNKTVRGRVCNINMSNSNYQVGAGNQLIAEQFVTVGEANLILGGGEVHAGGLNGAGAGSFSVINGGTVTMTNAADRLYVGSGGALFEGASTAGKLTAGIFTLKGGSMTTAGGAADAFAPSGTFSTEMSGTTSVNFPAPASSFFTNLTLAAGTTMNISSDVLVKGTFARGSGAAVTTIASSSDKMLTAGGLNFSVNPTNFSNVRLRFVDGQPSTTFSTVKFEGFLASYTGIFFEVARSSGTLSFSGLDFSGQTVGASGRFVRNSGGANVAITGSTPTAGTLDVNFDKTGLGTITWP